ncbi:MAG: hypothetical protein Q9227_007350 [Pyrenula ochraceoflavens]
MVFYGGDSNVPISTKDINSYLFDNPEYDLDKPIFNDASNPSKSLTFRQSRTIVRQLAAGFRKAGLKKGDVCCIHAFNSIYYTPVVLGILAAGGIFAGTNPGYTPYELTHVLKIAEVKFVLTEPEILGPLLKAGETAQISRHNIWIFDTLDQSIPKGFRSWRELLQHGEEDWVRFDDYQTASTTTAALFTSSGTTGLPKACCNTHYNLIAQDTLVYACDPRPYPIKRIIATPLFHAAVAPSCFVSALKGGFEFWIMRRFDLELYFKTFEQQQITELFIVPPIAIAIIMSPLNKKYSLKSARAGFCGAAPLEKRLQARLQELLGDAKFAQVWGMTETSCIGFRFPWPQTDTTGSIGQLLPTLTAKLIDDSGNEITTPNTPGELCLKGPTVIPGYHNNPTATTSSFLTSPPSPSPSSSSSSSDSSPYLKTGDIVYFTPPPSPSPSSSSSSSAPLWYILDRAKELIKTRGFQVAPPELEAVLMSHPGIIDAAVIGVPSPSSNIVDGEVPRAYVVRRRQPGYEALTEAEVQGWCKGRLSSYKELKGGVVFVEEVPKTASGKILKRVLRERAREEMKGEGGQKGRARL